MNSISFFKALLMKELNEKDLPGNQEKIAQAAEPKDKITGADFAALRAKKGVKKEVNTPNPPTDYSGKPAIPGLGPIVDVEEGKESELEKYERILHQLQNMNRSSNPSDESTKRKKIEDLKKKITKLKSKVTEGEDHEVSMAHNSLESVIKSAMELKAKLGDNEKDIPAWIQDHITNAENYINQASKNYHEYSNGEHDMDELPDGTVELPAGDEEDTEMSLQGLMETIKNKKKRK